MSERLERLIVAVKAAAWIALHVSCGLGAIVISDLLAPDLRGAALGVISALAFATGVGLCSTARWILTGESFI